MSAIMNYTRDQAVVNREKTNYDEKNINVKDIAIVAKNTNK